MIGVILAAGMAKRLRPLTDTKPKCLLKVGERTLLERTVAAMAAAGISEFVVVTGYRAEMIKDFLDNQDGLESQGKPRFTYLHNADFEHNNNIYSLWMAGEIVRGRELWWSIPRCALRRSARPVALRMPWANQWVSKR